MEKKIIIWGNGSYYEHRKFHISKVFYNIIAFVHGDKNYWGKMYEDYPIIAPEEINNYEYDYVVIAVKNKEKIKKQLEIIGISKEKIIELMRLDSCRIQWLYPNYNNKVRKIIRTYFFDFPNVGDSLNMFMFEKIFDVQIEKANIRDADMIGIGSILDDLLDDNVSDDYIQKPVNIFGSGLMFENQENKKNIRPFQIRALRGRKTKQILEKILNQKIECVLADPGLLVSDLINEQKKRYEVGIVPHHMELDDSVFCEMQKKYSNSVVIDVTDNPLKVIEQIANCKCIIATSLHGLIMADAFGIPNMWCKYSDKILGGEFKYCDYYSSYDLEVDPFYIKHNEFPEVTQIIEEYKVPFEQVQEKKMQLKVSFMQMIKDN